MRVDDENNHSSSHDQYSRELEKIIHTKHERDLLHKKFAQPFVIHQIEIQPINIIERKKHFKDQPRVYRQNLQVEFDNTRTNFVKQYEVLEKQLFPLDEVTNQRLSLTKTNLNHSFNETSKNYMGFSRQKVKEKLEDQLQGSKSQKQRVSEKFMQQLKVPETPFPTEYKEFLNSRNGLKLPIKQNLSQQRSQFSNYMQMFQTRYPTQKISHKQTISKSKISNPLNEPKELPMKQTPKTINNDYKEKHLIQKSRLKLPRLRPFNSEHLNNNLSLKIYNSDGISLIRNLQPRIQVSRNIVPELSIHKIQHEMYNQSQIINRDQLLRVSLNQRLQKCQKQKQRQQQNFSSSPKGIITLSRAYMKSNDKQEKNHASTSPLVFSSKNSSCKELGVTQWNMANEKKEFLSRIMSRTSINEWKHSNINSLHI